MHACVLAKRMESENELCMYKLHASATACAEWLRFTGSQSVSLKCIVAPCRRCQSVNACLNLLHVGQRGPATSSKP